MLRNGEGYDGRIWSIGCRGEKWIRMGGVAKGFTKPEGFYARLHGPAPFSAFAEIVPLDTVVSQLANGSTYRFDKVGEWTAFIFGRAPMSYREYYLKYVRSKRILCIHRDHPLNYLFSFAPVLTEGEIMEICASMKPMTP